VLVCNPRRGREPGRRSDGSHQSREQVQQCHRDRLSHRMGQERMCGAGKGELTPERAMHVFVKPGCVMGPQQGAGRQNAGPQGDGNAVTGKRRDRSELVADQVDPVGMCAPAQMAERHAGNCKRTGCRRL